MAAGKYRQWLEPEALALLKGWARDGLRDEEIADRMRISASTLYEWKKKYPEISEALKEGKEVADYRVEDALYAAALDGNITAIIFWLKNRQRDKWRDKPDAQESAKEDASVTIYLPDNGRDRP